MDQQSLQQIQDAFSKLPVIVQNAITDADVQAQLRKLAKAYSLHLDKWVVLENEIMLALVGITEPVDLAHNIVDRVGLEPSKASEITKAVVSIVFDPIQQELQDSVGKSKNALETIDAETKIDISKFSGAPTTPETYKPKSLKTYVANNDPYHEPVE